MKTQSKQHGFALLVLVTLLATVSTTLAVKAINNNDNNPIARDQITATALAQAKEVLIGYAITYAETHPGEVQGYLPCPDQAGGNPEGSAEPNCGAKDVSAIGRLPWRTLDISPLRGGDGECLWYAVSGTYKNNSKTGLMNWDTNGQLQIYAANSTTLLTPSADNQAVAVIFSPGNALSGQDRKSIANTSTCGDNYAASNFLDRLNCPGINCRDNTVAAGPFIAGPIPDANGHPLINDRLIFITKQDIWNAMQKRRDFLTTLTTLDTMTRKVTECIANFGKLNRTSGVSDPANRSLPWPAQNSLADYSDITNYNDHNGLSAGRVPYKVNTARSQSDNLISSDFLLTKGTYNEITHHWENNCPGPDDWAAIYPWWDNWKDQLFYAIGNRFEPQKVSATGVCDSTHCLHVNNLGNYAAVVIFSGQKLAGQTRASSVTDFQRGIPSNYLEGRNAINVTGPANGRENYQSETLTAPPSSIFNDIVYCIKDDSLLTVVKGTAAGCP